MHLCEERNDYDYICTHVDNFKVMAKKPAQWVDEISAVFLLKLVARTSNPLTWVIIIPGQQIIMCGNLDATHTSKNSLKSLKPIHSSMVSSTHTMFHCQWDDIGAHKVRSPPHIPVMHLRE
jgi:hypothetical protein